MSEIIFFKNKKKEKIVEDIKCCIVTKSGIDWCPRRKWYMKDGCPFTNKHECDLYREMCNGEL